MKGIRFLLCLCFLQGCALQSYLASQVDFLLEMRLQSHLDLYYKQKKMLAQDIDLWLGKQKIYVPEARDLLVSIDPLKPQPIQSKIERFLTLYKRSAHEFNQLLCKYLSQLDSNQQQHFFGKQVDDNDELKKQIAKMNLEKLTERVEFFIGPIAEGQQSILKSFLPYWQKRSRDRLERRLVLQTELKRILTQAEKNKEELLNLAFRKYVDSSFEDPSQLVSFLESLASTLTLEQTNHLLDRKTQALKLLNSFNQSTF